MGYSVSWLAVRGKPSIVVLSELGLRGTGEYDEVPDSPDLWGANLPDGWYLVFANRCDYVERLPLDRLSAAAQAVTCSVEEHVMVSWASGWSDGRRVWSVTHDSEKGIEHIEAEGDLPPVFTSLWDQLAAQQAGAGGEEGDVDYLFDVPVELAKAVTGFRHDEGIPDSDDAPFEKLAAAPRVSRPLLSGLRAGLRSIARMTFRTSRSRTRSRYCLPFAARSGCPGLARRAWRIAVRCSMVNSGTR
jgi:hypothetical protein